VKERGFEPEEDGNMVRAGGGESVGPPSKVWREERASKGKLQDAGAPN